MKQGIEIWPIGSGKGGVGKTLLTANLGILLSRMNKKVVILDADLGAANLHTALGIPYINKTLNDLITGNAGSLSDILLETPFPGLSLIGGNHQLPAVPDYQNRLTDIITKGVSGLEADILLIDLGGGIASHVLDLFLLSNQGIVVSTNDPASIQNTYRFLKMAVYRKILRAFPSNPLISYMVHASTHAKSREKIASVPEFLDKVSHVDRYYTHVIQNILKPFRPRMIINMIDKHHDYRAATVLDTISRKFIGITPELIGTMEYDPGIKQSTLNLRPFSIDPENQKASEQLSMVANHILEPDQPAVSISHLTEDEDVTSKQNVEKKEYWLMDNVQHNNRPLYVLTEKLSPDGAIQTSVYFHGKIVLSKKMHYPELNNGNMDENHLKKLIHKQHLTAIKGIEQGRLAIAETE